MGAAEQQYSSGGSGLSNCVLAGGQSPGAKDAIASLDGRAPLTHLALGTFLAAPPVLGGSLAAGSRIAYVLPGGSPEAVTFFLACVSTGAAVAPLNPDLSGAEYTFDLQSLKIDVLVVAAGNEQGTAAKAASELGIKVLGLTPDAATCGVFKPLSLTSGQVDATPDALALLLHTSGTTSRPKVVPLSHKNLSLGALLVSAALDLQPGTDVSLNLMPLFHIHGLLVNCIVSLVSGAKVVCAPGMDDPAQMVRWLTSDAQATWYSAVPTMHLCFIRACESRWADGAPSK